jgi:tetratricopeptide (TPR) repeat protein
MASVFLSYDREDVGKARPIAAALEKAGHSVWWDQHIKSGTQYSKVIEEALKAADAVVVLWSSRSVDSPWVRDEAAAGRDSARLVPVTLDGTEPPLGFRQYQTIDLGRWRGRGLPAPLKTLIADVQAIAAKQDQMPPPTAQSTPRPVAHKGGRRLSGYVTAAGLALLILLSGSFWLFRSQSVDLPKAAVVAADASTTSRRMAGDVLVALGDLQSSAPTKLQLIDGQSNSRPDLKVTIGGMDGKSARTANASLSSLPSQTILWSKQFKQDGGMSASLEERIALSVGRVLRCAAEELAHGKIASDGGQLYLKACAEADEVSRDTQAFVRSLRKVIERAPTFAPAWTRLLAAEAAELRQLSIWQPAERQRADLSGDVQSARKAVPGLPEIAVAEASLARGGSFEQPIAILDKAIAEHPDSPWLLSARSELMSAVGRTSSAAEDARRSAELDKFSPAFRSLYIKSLVFNGKTDFAREELRRANQLWPESEAIRSANTMIELRYGDFVKALPLSGARMDGGISAYIKARQQPTRANKDALLQLARTHQLITGQKRFLLEALPDLDRVDDLYALVESWPTDQGLVRSTDILFAPWTAKFRRDHRFMRYARRVGLVDYWQKSGNWPDFCSEPDMPYNCEAEAANLK